ncbi:hypothetical protein NHE_0575 [Neorickettsia helminthoeca str. Oregon]|uniref:Uncharacterized protein n=1 Tax=Neorickettsia helminthoeca str. Oregon TaxID=1286528 RepID=X5H4C3_9RICK|nr:hypothetical protein [Neorickettsia helminthoeca]AHX11513.1 hypothetical protein NHE_0575 [Neorickettsia helminthoeca str. Oregon]
METGNAVGQRSIRQQGFQRVGFSQSRFTVVEKYKEFFLAVKSELGKALVIDRLNYAYLSHILWKGATPEEIRYYKEAIEGGVRVCGSEYKSPKARPWAEAAKAAKSTTLLNRLCIVDLGALNLFKVVFEYALCDFLSGRTEKLTKKHAVELVKIFKRHFRERPICMGVEHLSNGVQSLLRTPRASYRSGNRRGKCTDFPTLYTTVYSTADRASRFQLVMVALFASSLCDFFSSIKVKKYFGRYYRLKYDLKNMKYLGFDYTSVQKANAVLYILSEVENSGEYLNRPSLGYLQISETPILHSPINESWDRTEVSGSFTEVHGLSNLDEGFVFSRQNAFEGCVLATTSSVRDGYPLPELPATNGASLHGVYTSLFEGNKDPGTVSSTGSCRPIAAPILNGASLHGVYTSLFEGNKDPGTVSSTGSCRPIAAPILNGASLHGVYTSLFEGNKDPGTVSSTGSCRPIAAPILNGASLHGVYTSLFEGNKDPGTVSSTGSCRPIAAPILNGASLHGVRSQLSERNEELSNGTPGLTVASIQPVVSPALSRP